MDLSCKEIQEMIITASFDNTAKIWAARSGQLLHTLAGYTSGVRSANFSPDGRMIFTGSFDGKVNLYESLY